MRLMHCAGAGTAGGLLAHVARLVGGLREAGHDVHAVLSPEPAVDRVAGECAATGAAVTRLRVRGKTDAAGMAALRRLVAREGPDVFHLHLSSPVEGLPALIAARLGGARRIVTTEHAPTWHPLRRLHSRAAKGFASRWVRAVIAVSESDARYLREEFRVAGRLLRVIPNGVPSAPELPPREEARRRLGLPAGAAPVAGFAGEIEEKKGIGDLIEAARTSGLPDLAVVLAGEGSLRADLLRRADGLPFRLLLPGRVEPIADLLGALDLFVFPSHQEAMPLALLEAMAAGLPVIATRVGGIPEAVEDGASGLLVEPRDPAALAGAMRQLAADPGAARRLGEAARRRVAERFALERMVRDVEALYNEVIAA